MYESISKTWTTNQKKLIELPYTELVGIYINSKVKFYNNN